MHVQEDFPQSSVFIFSCPDIELVPAYRGFLGIACPAIRQVPMCSSGRYELARLGGEGVSIGILVISGLGQHFCSDLHGSPGCSDFDLVDIFVLLMSK